MIRRPTGTAGSASVPVIVGAFLAGVLVAGIAIVEVVPADKLATANAGGAAGGDVNGNTGTGTNTGTNTNTGGKPGTKGGSGSTGGGGTGTTGGNGSTGGGNGSTGGGNGPVAIPPSKFECAPGKNGGNTDRGVTGSEIRLPTTIVASGIARSFLGEMRYAMEAAADAVNRTGGICGRRLVIETKDDGWNPQTGAQYLRNYINDKSKFGIPVGASSEGLQVVIRSGDLDRAQFPAIGTDGLAIDQYAKPDGTAQPWVWPVATATVSSARIMANDAHKRGARKFGIVYDRNYRFGKEAAAAYNAEVKRLTGQNVDGFNTQDTCTKRFCGVTAGQNSYSREALDFKNSGADFVALFLEPDTALTWMQDPNTLAATQYPFGYGAAQPLFTKQFEAQCRAKCDQMVVWSGFKPNVEKYANDPAVQAYVRALKAKNPNADEFNQFTQSAYVGMQLLIEALRKVGPELTRQRLKAVLDHMTFKTGLTLQDKLVFTPTSRFANITMQAFVMQYKGSAGGWRLGVIAKDPRPQVD